ncbi:unnamed protein product [Sphenostylis stenocarpa]|uniref:Uncharacterized protein n=1 Tax=Sphenostylis stenocarpa TaxID=92480 RepID=A0AA86VM51_9FABA|nr:unnamed protein product [Sphenostylis stenocarpa]
MAETVRGPEFDQRNTLKMPPSASKYENNEAAVAEGVPPLKPYTGEVLLRDCGTAPNTQE